MLVITGASGHIGGQAADLLLSKGEKIRVVGREAAHLKRFTDKGAEAAIGDLLDRLFVARAFAGADAVFALIPPNYAAIDFREYQNRIGRAIAGGIIDAGVKFVVNLSSQGADLADGTGLILGLRDQEARLDTLDGVSVLHLRPTYFMENLLMTIPLIQQKGVAGSPIRGDVPFAMIATRDIAAEVAERLGRRDFSGKTVKGLLGARDLTLTEAVTVLGRAIGKPDLKYVQFSEEEARTGMHGMGVSPDVTRLYLEMCRAISERRFAAGRPRTPANTTATTIEVFAPLFAAAYKEAATPHAA